MISLYICLIFNFCLGSLEKQEEGKPEDMGGGGGEGGGEPPDVLHVSKTLLNSFTEIESLANKDTTRQIMITMKNCFFLRSYL